MKNNTHTIFLAFGSNVGDKKKYIDEAISLLKEKITVITMAPLYETKPWGYTEQATFLNTALKGSTTLSPLELLDFIKDVEQKTGRIKRFRWGPREIDIDILFYDDLLYQDERLIIPHPLLHERDFVLTPLQDIAPELLHPRLKKTIRELSEALVQK